MSSGRIRMLTVVVVLMMTSVTINLFAFQAKRGEGTTVALAQRISEQPSAAVEKAQQRAEAAAPVLKSGPAVIHGDRRALVVAVQRELQLKGYAPGSVDGVDGLRTGAAIVAYEFDHGLPLSGQPSDDLLQTLIMGRPRAPGALQQPPGPVAGRIIRTVQTSLSGLGYEVGGIDGRLGPLTRAAIEHFERDLGLKRTGRVSGPLIEALGSKQVTDQIRTARARTGAATR
ncbi:MAG: peptidoglycan-binding protein [Pseudomonadota bacterium]